MRFQGNVENVGNLHVILKTFVGLWVELPFSSERASWFITNSNNNNNNNNNNDGL